MTDNRFKCTLSLLGISVTVMFLMCAVFGWFAASVWITEQVIGSRSPLVFMTVCTGIPFAFALVVAFIRDLRGEA